MFIPKQVNPIKMVKLIEKTVFEVMPMNINHIFFKCIDCHCDIIKFVFFRGFLWSNPDFFFNINGFVPGVVRYTNDEPIFKCPNCQLDFEGKYDGRYVWITNDKLILF